MRAILVYVVIVFLGVLLADWLNASTQLAFGIGFLASMVCDIAMAVVGRGR
jgi:hypothetical protein